ncbi:hypothetical protein MRB53_033533 [Persea americana]|uniref:Uncharacterized protein n=1 Tax=Persea americana TaxID=3435 RepID=A0ACC2KVI0_PERAE|nr:hypothetical protein MRB53_033533 [Persea americana]
MTRSLGAVGLRVDYSMSFPSGPVPLALALVGGAREAKAMGHVIVSRTGNLPVVPPAHSPLLLSSRQNRVGPAGPPANCSVGTYT